MLKPLADRHVLLDDLSERSAPAARAALHHLERSLFEPGAGRVAPNGAVRLLEAGGERAEAELVAAEVLELTGAGMLPDDIAVLVRGGAGEAEVPARCSRTTACRSAWTAGIPFARTRLGAGALAAARAALPGGAAGRRPDLAAHSRSPRRSAHGRGARTPHPPRRARRRPPKPEPHCAQLDDAPPGANLLAALDALAAAAAEGAEAFLEAIVAETDAIWTAPHRRAAAVLDPDEAADARAAATLRAAARSCARWPPPTRRSSARRADILAALADVPVRERRAPGAVLVADPLAIRGPPLPCGLRVRPAGRRVPAPPDARSRSSTTPRAPASRGPAGSCSPLHEDVLARERVAVLRGGLAARGGALPVVPLVRRGGRAGAAVRRSSTTFARFSPTSCGSGAAGGCSPRSRGRRREAPTPHELRRARAARRGSARTRRRSARR